MLTARTKPRQVPVERQNVASGFKPRHATVTCSRHVYCQLTTCMLLCFFLSIVASWRTCGSKVGALPLHELRSSGQQNELLGSVLHLEMLIPIA